MTTVETGLKAAVAGSTGYVGGELLRLLVNHPQISEIRGFSTRAAGRQWAEIHPNFLHHPGRGGREWFQLAGLGHRDRSAVRPVA